MSTEQLLLLVDDDPTFCEVMARSMTRRGFSVQIAHNAEEALARADEYQPGHILLDLNLPGRSGLLVLPEILERVPGALVVILTGYSSIATAVEAMKLGATNYLCKPATGSEVIQAFAGETTSPETPIAPQPLSVDRLEWEHIQKILQRNDGNITATARALGMHRRTLQRKLQKRPVRK